MEARELVVAIRAFGLTQTEVSDQTGIPQPTISKIERGEVEDVMSKNYRALQALHAELVKKHTTKTEAIAMLGGSVKSAAQAIGCTVQAVHKWPDVLSPRIADRVIAARTRLKDRKATSRRQAESA